VKTLVIIIVSISTFKIKMKKLTLLVCVSIIVLIACNQDPKKQVTNEAQPCTDTIGFSLSYNESLTYKSSKKATVGNLVDSHRITKGFADTLAQNYFDESSRDLWHPLKVKKENGEKDILRGFYVPRELLEEILKDKNNSGMRLYLGKYKGAERRHYTMVLTGAKDLGKLNKNGTDEEPYFDYIEPCPDRCGPIGSKKQ
jgi:hypothetical protein